MFLTGAGVLVLMLTSLPPDPGAAAGDHRALVLTDFTPRAPSDWIVVNDDVMGGRSRGAFAIHEGKLRFEGETNTDGGGFASLRWRREPIDLSAYTGVRLRVKGDGRRYTLRLTVRGADHRGQPLPYRADFDARPGDGWVVAEVPFAEFRPRWRGRLVRAPALDPQRLDSVGLQIYDGRDGPFRLEVDRIEAYRDRPPFSMADYR